MINTYGVDNCSKLESIKKKKIKTSMENFGTEHPMKNEEVKSKLEKTFIEKFGCKNPMQNASIAERSFKNSKKYKKFYFKGEFINYQGYEIFYLERLLKRGFERKDFSILGDKEFPKIKYVDTEGKQRIYFPDFFIPKLNLVVEIKSLYTFENDRENNILKFEHVKNEGYNFYCVIYKKDGEIDEIIK